MPYFYSRHTQQLVTIDLNIQGVYFIASTAHFLHTSSLKLTHNATNLIDQLQYM